MAPLSSIDLRIAERLRDREFRRHWFRAALESNVPELFRDLRELRNMTQSELADAADMQQSAVSRFEIQRVANWKLETLLKLADALDAQLEILLVPAEDVIARHAREEAGGGTPQKSVLDAGAAATMNEQPQPVGGLLAQGRRRQPPQEKAFNALRATSAAQGGREHWALG